MKINDVKYRIFISLTIAFLITSCISYRYIDIQVLNPGSVHLPSDITIHLIHPQILDSESNLSIKDTSISKLYWYQLLIQNLDSTFKNHLEESPAFSHSKVIIQNEKEFHMEVNTMSNAVQMKQILLSVEKVNINESDIYMDYDPMNFKFTASYSLIYKFKMELRNIGTDRFYDTSVLSDTITWNSNGFNKSLLLSKLPTESEAIIEIGKIAGENYAEKIAPYWTNEERMLFYASNRYMRQGYQNFLDNNLQGAIQSWQHLYEAGTANLASMAAHNIGLLYEIMDDFEKSEYWLNKAIKAKYHFQTDQYLDRIKERNASRKYLDEEMVQP